MTDIIKCISLWQPWASLWLSPNKVHETRHWATKHRGPLLVHAANKIVFDIEPLLDDVLTSEFGGHWGRDLPTGALLGIVNLEDCVPTEDIYRGYTAGVLSEGARSDLICGDFDDGRYGWRRGGWKVFAEPIAWKGHQRVFNVPREVVASAIATAKVFP